MRLPILWPIDRLYARDLIPFFAAAASATNRSVTTHGVIPYSMAVMALYP
jgi:hypothetical protein